MEEFLTNQLPSLGIGGVLALAMLWVLREQWKATREQAAHHIKALEALVSQHSVDAATRAKSYHDDSVETRTVIRELTGALNRNAKINA